MVMSTNSLSHFLWKAKLDQILYAILLNQLEANARISIIFPLYFLLSGCSPFFPTNIYMPHIPFPKVGCTRPVKTGKITPFSLSFQRKYSWEMRRCPWYALRKGLYSWMLTTTETTKVNFAERILTSFSSPVAQSSCTQTWLTKNKSRSSQLNYVQLNCLDDQA